MKIEDEYLNRLYDNLSYYKTYLGSFILTSNFLSVTLPSNDARVSYVSIAPGGWTKLREAIERAEVYCSDIMHEAEEAEVEKVNNIVQKISRRIG